MIEATLFFRVFRSIVWFRYIHSIIELIDYLVLYILLLISISNLFTFFILFTLKILLLALNEVLVTFKFYLISLCFLFSNLHGYRIDF